MNWMFAPWSGMPLIPKCSKGPARCAVRRLQENELRQVTSFVDLLASKAQMSSVTDALGKMYSKEQLDAMQFEIASAVRECLAISMRLPERVTNRPGAVG